MKVKLILRRIGDKQVVFFHPEKECPRWYVADISQKTYKTINLKEKQLHWDKTPDYIHDYFTDLTLLNFKEKKQPDWDNVVKTLHIDVQPMDGVRWSARAIEL